MMMVPARGIDQLKPSCRVSKLQAGDQAMLLQELKNAVHTRTSDVTVAFTQAILDLQRAERTRLASQQVDDRIARRAPVMPRLIQHSPRVLSPTRSGEHRHGIHSRRPWRQY